LDDWHLSVTSLCILLIHVLFNVQIYTFEDRLDLGPSLENGYLEMTRPGKPNSHHQQYRLTSKGLEALMVGPL